jgi:hypothetical protein
VLLGTGYKRLTIPGAEHAFGYWGALDTGTGKTVGQDVIDFLDAHLK